MMKDYTLPLISGIRQGGPLPQQLLNIVLEVPFRSVREKKKKKKAIQIRKKGKMFLQMVHSMTQKNPTESTTKLLEKVIFTGIIKL